MRFHPVSRGHFTLLMSRVLLVSALGFAKAHGATAERATDPEGWEMSRRWVKNCQAYRQRLQGVASLSFVGKDAFQQQIPLHVTWPSEARRQENVSLVLC